MVSKKVQLELEHRLQDIVRRVQAGEFVNNKSLSDFYGMSESFTPNIKTVILARGLLTEAQWISGFAKRHAKRPSHICPACRVRFFSDGQQISQREGGGQNQ